MANYKYDVVPVTIVISLLQHNDPDTDELEIDYSFFDEHIWPIIARRVPAFESLKVL